MTLHKGVDDEVPDMDEPETAEEFISSRIPGPDDEADPEPVWSALYLDGRAIPTVNQLRAALEPFDLHVYALRDLEHTNSPGFVFSNRRLTESKIRDLVGWDAATILSHRDLGEGFEQADLPGELHEAG